MDLNELTKEEIIKKLDQAGLVYNSSKSKSDLIDIYIDYENQKTKEKTTKKLREQTYKHKEMHPSVNDGTFIYSKLLFKSRMIFYLTLLSVVVLFVSGLVLFFNSQTSWFGQVLVVDKTEHTIGIVLIVLGAIAFIGNIASIFIFYSNKILIFGNNPEKEEKIELIKKEQVRSFSFRDKIFVSLWIVFFALMIIFLLMVVGINTIGFNYLKHNYNSMTPSEISDFNQHWSSIGFILFMVALIMLVVNIVMASLLSLNLGLRANWMKIFSLIMLSLAAFLILNIIITILCFSTFEVGSSFYNPPNGENLTPFLVFNIIIFGVSFLTSLSWIFVGKKWKHVNKA